MTRIHLGSEGKFFSGRSHAAQIISQYLKESPQLPIEINFDGVESAAQSFISELLVRLIKSGIAINSIKFTGIKDQEVQKRVQREIERLSMIIDQL